MDNNFFDRKDYQNFDKLLTILISNPNSNIKSISKLLNSKELKIVEKINEIYLAFKRTNDDFSILLKGMEIHQIGIIQYIENIKLKERKFQRKLKRKKVLKFLSWLVGIILVIIGLIFKYLQYTKQSQNVTNHKSNKENLQEKPHSKAHGTVSINTIKDSNKRNIK
jgi:uncharacterized membrane protein YidH (DUF202 family)